jgi:hypothetical protein
VVTNFSEDPPYFRASSLLRNVGNDLNISEGTSYTNICPDGLRKTRNLGWPAPGPRIESCTFRTRSGDNHCTTSFGTCMHACMLVCARARVCVYVCMYACLYACMHICMYVLLPYVENNRERRVGKDIAGDCSCLFQRSIPGKT